MIHPYMVKQSKGKLCITDSEFEKNPRPILWCRDGLYAMLPIEVIRNEVAHQEDLRKMKINSPLVFHWAAAVKIPYETGLAMEKVNGKS